jgi:cell wall-associated NlpC family hydrolase
MIQAHRATASCATASWRWPALVVLAIGQTIAAGCASSHAVPHPFPTPLSPAVLPAHEDAIVATALALRGAPYRAGGSTPAGFDCSGFTQYVFSQNGIALAREVRAQFDQGQTVPLNQVEKGDLLFFSTVAPGPSHVAIAIGNGEFIHAPSSDGVVRVERVDASYWAGRFIGARRVG